MCFLTTADASAVEKKTALWKSFKKYFFSTACCFIKIYATINFMLQLIFKYLRGKNYDQSKTNYFSGNKPKGRNG